MAGNDGGVKKIQDAIMGRPDSTQPRFSNQLTSDFVRHLRWLVMFLATVPLAEHASAQLVISDPAAASESVRQASLAQPRSELPPATMREVELAKDLRGADRTPVRVSVQYLMVDADARAKIYGQLDSGSIGRASHRWTKQADRELHTIDQSELTANQLFSTSRITTCLMSESEASAAIGFATKSAGSNVSRAPSVLLLEGKPAEINDIVQRPFVIDVVPNGNNYEPQIEVLDVGNKIRMLASMPGGTAKTSPVHLKVEFTASRILGITTDKIFGLQDEPLTVQVPTHQITTAFASVEIPAGKALLIDPHVPSTNQVSSESSVPVLGKIPYVGRSFKNTELAEVEQYLMLLLKPSIEESVR